MASVRHGFLEPGDLQAIRLVVDTIPTLAWSARPDSSAEFFNQRWLDYTGLSAKQALDSGWEVAIHPEDRKSGHIFQVSSVGGRLGVPGNTPYHAAKWAVGGFSDSLAMEVAPFGVKVCTLEPGGIRTNWARRAVQNAPDLLPEYEATVGSFLKMLRGLEGRLEGDPRKIANVIVQLANSDEVPMRLILGVDAEQRVQRAEAARALEAEKWRHLTVSTVFEDGL